MYKVILHGLLLTCLAILPISAFGANVTTAAQTNETPQIEKVNGRFHFGVYYGRPYYYRPYYYYYPYRPYYYRNFYYPYRSYYYNW